MLKHMYMVKVPLTLAGSVNPGPSSQKHLCNQKDVQAQAGILRGLWRHVSIHKSDPECVKTCQSYTQASSKALAKRAKSVFSSKHSPYQHQRKIWHVQHGDLGMVGDQETEGMSRIFAFYIWRHWCLAHERRLWKKSSIYSGELSRALTDFFLEIQRQKRSLWTTGVQKTMLLALLNVWQGEEK